MKTILVSLTIFMFLVFYGCGDDDHGSGSEDLNISVNETTNETTLPPPFMLGTPMKTYTISFSGNSWMSQINDNVSISDITMVGTHDSSTYKFADSYDAGAKKYVITQDKSIEEQLAFGVRVFDLRVEYRDGNLWMVHANYELDITLENVLIKFKNFLKAHPSEALIIISKQEESELGDRDFQIEFYTRMTNMNKSLSHFYLEENIMPTLEDLRGKMFLLRRNEKSDLKRKMGTRVHFNFSPKDGDYGNYHTINGNFHYFVQDWYKIDYDNGDDKAKTTDTSMDIWNKLFYVEENIKLALNDAVDRLYINHLSCNDTPSHGVGTIASPLNNALDKFVKDREGDGHGGVVMIDFASDWFVKHITKMNYVKSQWSGRHKINYHFGDENQGAGIAMGVINGKNHFIISYIDNPEGENSMYYRVSSDIKLDGTVDGWGKELKIDVHIGAENQGAGIAIGDTDGDGKNNFVVAYMDNPEDENSMYYRVSSNIKADGTVDHWSDKIDIGGWFGDNTEGIGIAIGDLDGDGINNLIVSFIDAPVNEENSYYLKISDDFTGDSFENAKVSNWTKHQVDGKFGAHNSGTGIAIFNKNDENHLIISYIDNPNGENQVYYKTSSALDASGKFTWSDREKIYGHYGNENAAAGITAGHIDGNNQDDFIFYFIDNPDGENVGYYKVGLNIE